MKVNYDFISKLEKLLRSDDWSIYLKERIATIDAELKITPEERLQERQSKTKKPFSKERQ